MSEPVVPDPYAAPQPAGDGSESAEPGSSTPSGPPAYSSFASGAPTYPAAAAPSAGTQQGTEANNLAVWSLVLAVLGWVCFGLLTSIPAIIVGGRAKRAAAEGRANNQGMATAGVVLGWIGTILNALVLLALALLVVARGWDGMTELLEEYGAAGTR